MIGRFVELFHDGGSYHIEISPLICIGFYMIGTSVIKKLFAYFLYTNFSNERLIKFLRPKYLKNIPTLPQFSKRMIKQDKSNCYPTCILPNLSEVYKRSIQNQMYLYFKSDLFKIPMQLQERL